MIESVVLIGRPDGLETTVSAVRKQTRTTRCFRTINDAVAERTAAELVVVFEHWPDEWTAEEIRDLMAAYPLARIVVCQGPWCASSGRTRRLWPVALAVPARDAEERIRRELDVIFGSRPPLPWTAGVDEVFSFDHRT